jgi:hypothetical protein
VQDRKAVDLFDDVADVDGGCRRAAIHDDQAVGAKIAGGDLRQETIAPRGQQLTLEDRAAHRAVAIGHGRRSQPLLSELAKALRLLDPPLLPLLFN